ncbi:MAG: glycoside hydrolase family 30 protein [Bryobacteraceae bacterium]
MQPRETNAMDRRTLLRRAAKAIAGSAACLALSPAPPLAAQDSFRSAIPGLTPTWIGTTQTAPWQTQPLRPLGWLWDMLDVQVSLESDQPAIDGFGACFNELGWTSLQALSPGDRESILAELFTPGKGANFTLCRMPVGANDFARKWYSYDETPDDFPLEHFSIANDLETLAPFIRSAQKYNPHLRLWASPWSPPSWMKRNKNYAMPLPVPGGPLTAVHPDEASEDMFIQEDRFFTAYAAYFGKFIDAYKQQGIEVGMVMPQNEFNSAQPFPSCTWSPEGLARFIRYLGPAMDARRVQIFLGTYERGNRQQVDRAMADAEARRWIKGLGVQWAGKGAVAAIRKQYPGFTIYQSEQECGDGRNDWSYAGYCWDLMKHYLRSGAAGYMYWNLSLQTGGESHWGWKQNSLVTVDSETKTYRFNPEYYLLKHVSHFVQPGARRLETDGTFDDLLAFLNPDKSVAVILRNESDRPRPVSVIVAELTVPAVMQPDSFNTLLVKRA